MAPPAPDKAQPALATRTTAQALTLLAAFFWGTSFVAIELGLEFINPFWFAQLRFMIASLGSLVVVLALKKRIGNDMLFSSWLWGLGLFNALGYLTQFFAQTLTNATKTALLVNINLITVAILSTVLLQERFTKVKVFAVGLSILGVFLLTTNGDPSRLLRGEFIGDMFALTAGFFWAIYIVLNKKVLFRPKVDVISLNACVMLSTTVILIPFTVALGGLGPGVLDIGYEGTWIILYISIFCNILPFIIWMYALRYLSATASTLLLLTEVLVAAILAMIVLGEMLTAFGILGGALIVAAILTINYRLEKIALH